MRALVFAVLLVACKGADAPAPSGGSAQIVPASAAGSSAPAADPWAEQAPRPLPPPNVTSPFPRPFIWKASKAGKSSYLFGTLHGGLDAEKRIPLWVWKHFEDATTIVEEANLQDLELQRWLLRPDGPSLRQELGEEYWSQFSRTVTPVVANLLDTQATAAAAIRMSGYGGGGEQAAPMDGALLIRAQGLAKRIAFLETSKFQSEMFVSLYTLDVLRRLIDRREQLAPLNPAFIVAYTDGDGDGLAELARKQFRIATADEADLDRFYERLLFARNRAWVPMLETELAKGGAFIAVGALHLVGTGSLVELLRDRGFIVERATE